MTDRTATDDDLDRTRASMEQPAPPAAGRVLLFVVCFALFLGGFALMALAVESASITLFTLGILASGGAFFVGMHRPER
ncbi:hypothetical protein [Cellulomonas sp. Marseille-Q8402]